MGNDRMPSQIAYTPANLEKRLAAAGAELGAYLAADPGVQAARADLERAQALLQLAKDRKAAIPYPTGPKPTPQRLREWQAAVSAQAAAEGEVEVAQKTFWAAQNDAAAARRSAGQHQEEKERADRLEAEAARHSMLEEANFREQAWAAAIASGSTREQFDKMFETMWRAELRRRTEARMGAQTRELRQSGKYQL